AASHHRQAGTVRLCGRGCDRSCHAGAVIPDPACAERRAAFRLFETVTAMAVFRPRAVTEDHAALRIAVIAIALIFVALFLVLPLAVVFSQALANGLGAAVDAIGDHDSLRAIGLTLTVAAVAVPLNAVFGIAAAWAIAKFD